MKFRNIEKEAFNETTAQGGRTWAIIKADGSLKRMEQAAGKEFESLGLCFGFEVQAKGFCLRRTCFSELAS